MKRTKLLALALAGVMALALLTGCSGGKTEDRRIAENIADIMKRSHPNVEEVSYSVPELSGAVRSAFAPDWLNEAGTVLERDALTQDGRTACPLRLLRSHCPGCGSQRLLRCRSHPAGRCPNSSSLFPPLAAVVAVAPRGRGTGVPVRPTRDEQSLSETVVPCYRGQALPVL